MNTNKYLPKPPQFDHTKSCKQLNKLYTTIEYSFGRDSERTKAVTMMHESMESRLVSAPASSKIQFHNAYPGGYLDHVLHVIEAAYLLRPVYERLGGALDFTEEEMVFAAMHHDLGKLGDEDGPAYFETIDPKDNNNGVYFKTNTGPQIMSCFDRTIYLLNKHGIKFNKHEMLAIKMADGVFSDENKTQFYANGFFPHRTHLGYFIHWADWMACITEKDILRKQFEENMNNDNF